jgi:hypothetical protein
MRSYKQLIYLLAFLFIGNHLSAQSIQLTPYSGYTFSSSTNIDGGKAKISGGHTFGGIFTFVISDYYDVEILYSRHINEVSARSTFFTEDFRSEAAYNYILGGINRAYPLPGTGLKFHGGTKIGAAILTFNDGDYSTQTNFAVGLEVGMTYLVNDFIGLRLGANVKAPITGTGVNLWWGSGSGPQVGLSSWAPIVQFNLLGGLVFNFNL